MSFGRESHHSRPRPTSGAGFTLIELLVVISIIALLVSMLLPSLRRARDMTRDLVCVNNVRAIGIAWQFYLEDSNGEFPPYQNTMHRFYGGVQPSLYQQTMPGFEYPSRPLNPYIDLAATGERVADVFRCPFDREIVSKLDGSCNTKSYTCFEYYGNCYLLNWTLLTHTDRSTGWPIDKGVPFFLDDVEAPPYMVLLTGDYQWFFTVNDAQWDAEFHNNEDRMAIVFLDGHADFMQLTRGVSRTADYTVSPHWD